MHSNEITEIIANCQKIRDEHSPTNPELAEQIDQLIAELKKLEASSKTDQTIDRTKKIAEILKAVAEIVFRFFSGL
ncbi:MAG: hypothetical protein H6575_13795 [Lewinellaceae bacterium]|nr:hypothetical protein [Lewinellaceae bacterium]